MTPGSAPGRDDRRADTNGPLATGIRRSSERFGSRTVYPTNAAEAVLDLLADPELEQVLADAWLRVNPGWNTAPARREIARIALDALREHWSVTRDDT